MKHPLPSRLAALVFLSMAAPSCVRQQTAEGLPDADLTKTGGLFAGVQRPPTEEELQAPLLLIGGRTVTYGDLVAESQRVAQAAGIPQDRIPEFKERVVDKARENLVLRNLLLIGAEREGLVAEPADIQTRIAEIERSLGGGQTLQNWLAMQGLTQQQFEAILGRELLEGKMRRQIAAKAAAPEEAEIVEFYSANPAVFQKPEGIRAESIQIPLPPKTAEEERRQIISAAELLREEFAAGATLETLKPKMPKGAALGPVFVDMKGTLPAIAPHIFKLKPGGVTDVLVVDNTCHIFRMISAQEASLAPLEEARPMIVRQLTDRREADQIVAYARELQKSVEIKNPDGSPAMQAGEKAP
jgi:hypothetical protein